MVLIRPLGDHAPRFAELGGSNVDDCLGVSRLYFFRIPLDDAIGILERLADLIEERAAGTVH